MLERLAAKLRRAWHRNALPQHDAQRVALDHRVQHRSVCRRQPRGSTPLADRHAETEHASLERRQELGRRSLRQQPALMQQQHVAAAGRLVEIGGGPHDGHSVGPALLQHRRNDRPQVPTGSRIHTDRRFVEQQQPWPRQQRAGQTELLLHSAGKLAGQTRGERAETGEAQQPCHPLGAQGRGHCMQVGEQVEVLGDAQVLVEAEALRHVTDRRMRQRGFGCHVMAEYTDVATRGAQQTSDQAQQGGLAGGIRADQAGDHPWLDRGRHTIQCNVWRGAVRAGERVAQRGDDHDRLGHRVAGNRMVTGMPWRTPSSGFSMRIRSR